MVKTLLIIAGLAIGAGVLYVVGGAVVLFVVETLKGIRSRHANKKKQRMYLETERALQDVNARAFLAEYEMIKHAMKSMDIDEKERIFR